VLILNACLIAASGFVLVLLVSQAARLEEDWFFDYSFFWGSIWLFLWLLSWELSERNVLWGA